jgi:hypothetical protein
MEPCLTSEDFPDGTFHLVSSEKDGELTALPLAAEDVTGMTLTVEKVRGRAEIRYWSGTTEVVETWKIREF